MTEKYDTRSSEFSGKREIKIAPAVVIGGLAIGIAASLVALGEHTDVGRADHGLDSGSTPTTHEQHKDFSRDYIVNDGNYDPDGNTLVVPKKPTEHDLYPNGR